MKRSSAERGPPLNRSGASRNRCRCTALAMRQRLEPASPGSMRRKGACISCPFMRCHMSKSNQNDCCAPNVSLSRADQAVGPSHRTFQRPGSDACEIYTERSRNAENRRTPVRRSPSDVANGPTTPRCCAPMRCANSCVEEQCSRPVRRLREPWSDALFSSMHARVSRRTHPG